MPASNKFLLADLRPLLSKDSPDLELWSSFVESGAVVIQSLVDRTGLITMPHAMALEDRFKMPTDLTNFSMTYEEVCRAQAQRLLDHSEKLQVPLYIMYSGGIDSTLMVVSFLKQATASQIKNNIVIALTPDCITENPQFYYKYIRSNLKIVSSEQNSQWFDKRHIIVGGEHNDQLLGTDVGARIQQMAPFEEFMKPYTSRLLASWFMHKGMSEQQANWWFDMMVWHARQAPCELTSTFDLLWWFNFCFKWQTVYLRMLLRAEPSQKLQINREFCNQYYHHFFGHEDFQKWSMLNPHLKIKDSWNSYKFHAKEVIYDFNKDQEYFDYKTKRASLYKLFLQKPVSLAITEDWQFLDQFDARDFYQPNNSFQRSSW